MTRSKRRCVRSADGEGDAGSEDDGETTDENIAKTRGEKTNAVCAQKYYALTMLLLRIIAVMSVGRRGKTALPRAARVHGKRGAARKRFFKIQTKKVAESHRKRVTRGYSVRSGFKIYF